MGDVTNVELTLIKERVDTIEKKLAASDEAVKLFYRDEWGKINHISDKVDHLMRLLQEDTNEHKKLEARVLKCEIDQLALKGDLVSSILTLEKKFLIWVATVATLGGSVGAAVPQVIKMLFP